MPDILLTTLNARYSHAAFGLRYLLANLGELRERAAILEFDISQRPTDIAELLLAHNPKIIGIGVYIWNAAQSRELVSVLKRIRPEVLIILGGPEVSFETSEQEIAQTADYVVCGEADLKFAEVCRALLSGSSPSSRVLHSELPNLEALALPYDLYDDKDVAHRIIYVEASRGCPFTCEFCLSSLDVPVRQFPLEKFLPALQALMDRGVRQFKFVDRTFNLNLNFSRQILEFFLQRYHPGLFLHFEMVPDRLPEGLRELISKFPPGSLQFEVGIQTFNNEVSARIKRRQNLDRLADNFHFLRSQTGVHIHADLIAGLPGESLESFAAGFDRLVALGPQEIQLGILKRLRGTPIVRHDLEWEMIYNTFPPYEILQNKLLDFQAMQRLRRFARYWDLIFNSGNFTSSAPLLWKNSGSPFYGFLRWTDWLYQTLGRNHSIALNSIAELLFRFLTTEQQLHPPLVARAIWNDFQKTGRSDKPEFLRSLIPESDTAVPSRIKKTALKRQSRHLAQLPNLTPRA
ncbi:MAG: DUF4080 domain-containing protein [Verrucomicrobiota bacterium]|nr:DUF4080 domain-containing protein [Verrucomicrobiota bacterium]